MINHDLECIGFKLLPTEWATACSCKMVQAALIKKKKILHKKSTSLCPIIFSEFTPLGWRSMTILKNYAKAYTALIAFLFYNRTKYFGWVLILHSVSPNVSKAHRNQGLVIQMKDKNQLSHVLTIDSLRHKSQNWSQVCVCWLLRKRQACWQSEPEWVCGTIKTIISGASLPSKGHSSIKKFTVQHHLQHWPPLQSSSAFN